MRETLNENPVAQIAVVGVLVLVVAVFMLKSFGGESGESGEAAPTAEAPAETATGEAGATVSGGTETASSSSTSVPLSRPLPSAVEAAYADGETIALLIIRPGGIEDRKVVRAAGALEQMQDVAFFTAPVGEIARYAPITGPLGVDQTPAMIVVSPRSKGDNGVAAATVTYGFQSVEDLRQAVIDAGYRGPELTYAPE
ncbi:MAG TPA: hypothetical protein VD761_03355 [Solirubrobacterales bacterium]|nr:hypothetical protein [Solirubrobacterales bacterium]